MKAIERLHSCGQPFCFQCLGGLYTAAPPARLENFSVLSKCNALIFVNFKLSIDAVLSSLKSERPIKTTGFSCTINIVKLNVQVLVFKLSPSLSLFTFAVQWAV